MIETKAENVCRCCGRKWTTPRVTRFRWSDGTEVTLPPVMFWTTCEKCFVTDWLGEAQGMKAAEVRR
jgi:hypothetical protein